MIVRNGDRTAEVRGVAEQENLDPITFRARFNDVIKKSCICNDLGEGPIVNHHLGNGHKHFAAVCPGPNIAYFSKISTLEEMVDHIYGRINLLNSAYRPNMFIKELKMYIEYFIKEAGKCLPEPNEKQKQYFVEFKNNLLEGIEYYKTLFPKMVLETLEYQAKMLDELKTLKTELENFINEYSHLFPSTIPSLQSASI